MNNNPVGWFEIYVADMERARKFYEAVFECKLSELPMPGDEATMWTFDGHMDRYGAAGALVKSQDMPPGGNSVLVYFSCEDCALESQRADVHGGELTRKKMSIGEHGFVALAKDSEGNLIGFHSMK